MLQLPAVAIKLPEAEPAGTKTDGGKVRAVLLLESVTVAPPVGAGKERVTLQVVVAPEESIDGLHCSETGISGGTRPREAVWELLPSVAVTTTV